MTQDAYDTATHLLTDLAAVDDILKELDMASGSWDSIAIQLTNEEKHFSRAVKLPVEACAITPFLNAVRAMYEKQKSALEKEFEEL